MKTSRFKLVGLSRQKSMTCEPLKDEGNYFWPTVRIDQKEFDKLWDEIDWSKNNEVDVSHNGLSEDGCPFNAEVIAVHKNV